MRRMLGCCAVVLVGCSSAASAPPRLLVVRPDLVMRSVFPSRKSVEELARLPAKPLPRREVAAVSRWRVEAAPEERVPFETRFTDVAFTKELRCVAREYGRLWAETRTSQPDERLERFILGACGVTSPRIVTRSWKIDASDHATEGAIFDAFDMKAVEPDVKEMKGRPAGTWLVRQGKEALLILVFGDTPDRNITATVADAAGRVTIQGSGEFDGMDTRINQGRDGNAICERDATVRKPAFRYTCTMAPGDRWAWIEVSTQPPKETALVDSHAFVLARRDLTSALELTSAPATTATTSAAEARQVILERVNRLRQAASLRPVTLAAEQSLTHDRLAAQFFRAASDHDRDRSDRIATGLVAGWDVRAEPGKMLRFGAFHFVLLTGAKSAESWMEEALESPRSRYGFLRPDAEQIAIGIAPESDVGGMGVVMTTYEFFAADRRGYHDAAVYERISQERNARKLPAVTSLPEMPVLEKEVALVRAGKRNPREVTDYVLPHETVRLQRPLAGAFSLVHDLSQLTVGRHLLTNDPLSLRVAVTSYTPEGSPWGYYAVYIISSVPDEVAARLERN